MTGTPVDDGYPEDWNRVYRDGELVSIFPPTELLRGNRFYDCSRHAVTDFLLKQERDQPERTAWRRFWRWLTTRKTCRECGLLQVEAESVECRCDWPNGLKGY